MADRVVMFSGGIASWCAAKRVAAAHGVDGLTLLFADTKIEDADLYRFIHEAAANVGAPLEIIAEGRTPWEVFRDVRFLGNSRLDPCSRILKREMLDAWLAARYTPETVTVYTGLAWDEIHRHERLAARKLPWVYEAPLGQPPYLSKRDMTDSARAAGIEPPRLYAMGFSHNNCGGGCVKAGIGHFANLYRKLPMVFAEWEGNENKMRDMLGNVSILRDRTGGKARPLPLAELRGRLAQGKQVDMDEIGGCGCFSDDDEPGAGSGAEHLPRCVRVPLNHAQTMWGWWCVGGCPVQEAETAWARPFVRDMRELPASAAGKEE